MNDIEVTSIDLVEGGNVFKQGHYLTLGYVPRDENGDAVDLSGRTLSVALWARDGIAFESDATYSNGVLRFTLNETVPAGNYQIEFTATSSTDENYRKKFPTNYNSGRISVQQSSDDAGNLGISVYTVAKIKSEQQAAQTAYQEEINPKITTLTQRVDDGVGAFTNDTEIIDARMGKTNLRQFNEETSLLLTDIAYNVKTFGAIGDGVVDDTIAVSNALKSGKHIFFPTGIYKITSAISVVYTKNAVINGDNAVIVFESSVHTEYMLRFIGSGINFNITNIQMNGNKNCNKALEILNNTTTQSTVNLRKLKVEKVKRSNQFSDGDGISVRGSFSDITIDDVSVKDCELPINQGIYGSVGISGISVRHYSDLIYPEKLTVLNSRIEDVYSSDGSYKHDQDGLKFMNSINVESSLFVSNTDFKNCYGRFIKSQVKTNVVQGGKFTNENALSSGFIDFQYGGAFVDGCLFVNRNGAISECILSGSTVGISDATTSISNIAVRNFGLSRILSFFSTYPRDGFMGQSTISNVSVKGIATNFVNYRINGNKNKINVENCSVDKLEDSSTESKAFIRLSASGSVSPFSSDIGVENCWYGDSANPVTLVLDRISGFNALAAVSERNNKGFLVVDRHYVVNKVRALGAPHGHYEILSGNIGAGVELTLDVNNQSGAHLNILFNTPNGSYANINSSRSRTTTNSLSTDVSVGNNIEPLDGTFRVWFSEPKKLKIKNTSTASNIYTIFVVSNAVT